MPDTSDDLQRLLDALERAFADATREDAVRRALVGRLFSSLDRPRSIAPLAPSRLPACRHFERAVANVGDRVASSAALARALAALEPSLAWYRRIGSDAHGEPFHDGHANAFVVGPGGVEDRPGAAVGVSLLAPRIRYPDHHHAPEELYLVLSPGHWCHGASPWFEPGMGGVVHNVPDIVHAMRSGDEPLLAIWCLLD